jgi:DNA modification methylase
LVEIPVINADGTLIAGHQRLKILLRQGKGEEYIDVRYPSRQLTEDEFKEYLIRSNVQTGEFDSRVLADNFDLSVLESWGVPPDVLSVGPDTERKPRRGEDDLPDLTSEPIVKIGDIFTINGHRIICGDSTRAEVWEALMQGEQAKLCFTSPPYNVGAGNDLYHNYNDNKNSEQYVQFNMDVIKNAENHIKGYLMWNLSYSQNARQEFIEIYYRICKESQFDFLEQVVWHKKSAMPVTSNKFFVRTHESIMVAAMPDTIIEELEMYYLGTNQPRTYVFNKTKNAHLPNHWEVVVPNDTQLATHKATFPVALPEKGILLTTSAKDIVVDPFLGAGTTLIASEKNKRVCYGIELSPQYVELAICRYADFCNGNVVFKHENGNITLKDLWSGRN